MNIIIFSIIFISLFQLNNIECTKYNIIEKYDEVPTWKTIDSRPLPDWYDKAKVGIFLHWGVYAVPSFGSEWFWTNWKNANTESYVNYMNQNYKPGFTYQEFAHDFTAQHFNATEWVDIFKKSGAKYVVLTSKHHEGYTMWPSSYSFSWNSVDLGPHRDIVGELAQEVRAKSDIKFGVYYSLYEWFNPMYLHDKEQSFTENTFANNKVWPELKELINRYKPEVLWSDGDWEAPDSYWRSTEFLTWLYNESPVNQTVVTNDRWGIGTTCQHGGFYTCMDRFNPGVLQSRKWENAMTIDRVSWGHRTNAKLSDFLSSKDLVKEIVTTVSCGGNILMNVGPDKYGLIEPIFVERLLDVGKWLNINGEAIYESVPWLHQNDSTTPNVWYTTTEKETENRRVVYAIVLDYPYTESGVNLFSLGGLLDEQSKVHLLGFDSYPLQYYKSQESVYVKFPNKQQIDVLGLDFAWTLKFDLPQ